MNLKEYLQKRKRIEKQQQEEMSLGRVSCLKCFRPKKVCFCHEIVPIQSRTKFVILMHPKEYRKEKVGTGLLSHVCLENSEIIVGENFDGNKRVKKLISMPEYEPYILYPGEDSQCIDSGLEKNGKKLLIFIIDGTWACAKSMMRDSLILHDIPKVSFSATEKSKFSIKHQPDDFCLSTIESIYYVIEELKKHEIERKIESKVLMETLQKLVDFQKKCASDPSLKSYRRGNFKEPSERSKSKKWKDRKICFEKKNYHHLFTE